MAIEDDTSATAKPLTKSGLIPYLQIDGAVKAADFYKRAFGAEVAMIYPVDDTGRTMHVHLHINNSSLMLSDVYPEHGHPMEKPQGYSLLLPVDDIHAWWKRATAAGATEVMPIAEMFWGDLYCQLRDPYGVLWAMNQPKR